MATQGGPPPGWYPDPMGSGGVRWWDGVNWTEHFAPYQPGTLRNEAGVGRWAQILLLAAAPVQVLNYVVTRNTLRDFIDEVRRAVETDTEVATTTFDYGLLGVLSQVLSLVSIAAVVLFLVWFFRSAENGRALGLPARRSPVAGIMGFIIPIINLWWPYGSVRDLFPDDQHKSLVLRWFLLWILGGFVGVAIVVIAAFTDDWWGTAVLLIPAVLVTLSAVSARDVVAKAVETHEGLAKARQP